MDMAALAAYKPHAETLAPYIGAWTALFFFVRFGLFPKRSADFGNRVVSIVHALAAIALAVPAVDWANPLGGVGQANTEAQVRRGDGCAFMRSRREG